MRTRRPDRAPPGHPPLTGPDPLVAFERTRDGVGSRYRLERLVAASEARVLFEAFDQRLKRRVSLRVNFFTDEPTRAWFLREGEALGQLDHPGDSPRLRHRHRRVISPSGSATGSKARASQEGVERGPRMFPSVIALARDMLGALEHAHLQGIMLRRIVPATVLLGPAGRATVTDLRFSSYTLPAIPAGPSGRPLPIFMAPEVRAGRAGRPDLRRLHGRRAALLRRHRPGAAARPRAVRPARPSSGPTAPECSSG